MKILQINTVCDSGSTGSNARDIAEILLRKGNECYIAYGYGTPHYPYSIKIGSLLENLFHNVFFSRFLGLHGYGTIIGTRKLIKWIEDNRPDVIHINNLHANYLNYPMLFKYIILKDIPVLFTLHDCFNYTGKCSHYTRLGCNKWKTECCNCPTYRDTIAPSLFFDRSRRIFQEKKAYYSQMKKLTVVAVSKWLMQEVSQSILAGNGHKITNIYNWVDTEKFQRASNDDIIRFYAKYGLSSDYTYLLSVSAGWSEKDSKYQDAISLSSKLPENYKLIIVGNKAKGTNIPERITHIPYIDGAKELSAAYSLAAAYIHLSVEDTFGKVIAEAMACGTVPITFNSTACGEIAGNFGVIVEPHDTEAIVSALSKLDELKGRREEMINYVKENYCKEKNIDRYLEIYRELVGGQDPN